MFEQITEDIKANYYQQNFPNDGQRFLASRSPVGENKLTGSQQ
jgi:hypothetical protein